MGWGSVRSTVGIRLGDVGKTFFYEARVDSGGIIQVGWGTKRCRMSATDGIGDDRYISIIIISIIIIIIIIKEKKRRRRVTSRLTLSPFTINGCLLLPTTNRNSWAWDGFRKRIWHAGGSIFFHHTPLWQTVCACACACAC
jgi:hypothetical protein